MEKVYFYCPNCMERYGCLQENLTSDTCPVCHRATIKEKSDSISTFIKPQPGFDAVEYSQMKVDAQLKQGIKYASF